MAGLGGRASPRRAEQAGRQTHRLPQPRRQLHRRRPGPPTGVTIGKQDIDGMSPISGISDSRGPRHPRRGLRETGRTRHVQPVRPRARASTARPSQDAIDGDTRSCAQRNHDALNAAGRALLASGELRSAQRVAGHHRRHHHLAANWRPSAGKALTGGGSPAADERRDPAGLPRASLPGHLRQRQSDGALSHQTPGLARLSELCCTPRIAGARTPAATCPATSCEVHHCTPYATMPHHRCQRLDVRPAAATTQTRRTRLDHPQKPTWRHRVDPTSTPGPRSALAPTRSITPRSCCARTTCPELLRESKITGLGAESCYSPVNLAALGEGCRDPLGQILGRQERRVPRGDIAQTRRHLPKSVAGQGHP